MVRHFVDQLSIVQDMIMNGVEPFVEHKCRGAAAMDYTPNNTHYDT